MVCFHSLNDYDQLCLNFYAEKIAKPVVLILDTYLDNKSNLNADYQKALNPIRKINSNRALPVLKYEQHVHYSRSVYIQYGLSWSVTYQQILRLSSDLLLHSLLKQFIISQNAFNID
uniref:Uncharacterized protein n=1 Tax=Glossina pallidipes TaxID=7398 RepID=A0A1A9Z4K8_GLOPL